MDEEEEEEEEDEAAAAIALIAACAYASSFPLWPLPRRPPAGATNSWSMWGSAAELCAVRSGTIMRSVRSTNGAPEAGGGGGERGVSVGWGGGYAQVTRQHEVRYMQNVERHTMEHIWSTSKTTAL